MSQSRVMLPYGTRTETVQLLIYEETHLTDEYLGTQSQDLVRLSNGQKTIGTNTDSSEIRLNPRDHLMPASKYSVTRKRQRQPKPGYTEKLRAVQAVMPKVLTNLVVLHSDQGFGPELYDAPSDLVGHSQWDPFISDSTTSLYYLTIETGMAKRRASASIPQSSAVPHEVTSARICLNCFAQGKFRLHGIELPDHQCAEPAQVANILEKLRAAAGKMVAHVSVQMYYTFASPSVKYCVAGTKPHAEIVLPLTDEAEIPFEHHASLDTYMADIPDSELGEVLHHIVRRYETGVAHFHHPLSKRLIFVQVDPFGRFLEVMPIPLLKKLMKAHVTYAEEHNLASGIKVYDLEPFLDSWLSTQFESITVTRAVLESATVNHRQQGPIIHMIVYAKDGHQLEAMQPFVRLRKRGSRHALKLLEAVTPDCLRNAKVSEQTFDAKGRTSQALTAQSDYSYVNVMSDIAIRTLTNMAPGRLPADYQAIMPPFDGSVFSKGSVSTLKHSVFANRLRHWKNDLNQPIPPAVFKVFKEVHRQVSLFSRSDGAGSRLAYERLRTKCGDLVTFPPVGSERLYRPVFRSLCFLSMAYRVALETTPANPRVRNCTLGFFNDLARAKPGDTDIYFLTQGQ